MRIEGRWSPPRKPPGSRRSRGENVLGDVLGLPEIERPDFPVGAAWFKLGAQELHIGVEEDHQAPDRQHFAVLVESLDSAVAAIEAHGISVRKTGLTFKGAGYQAFLRDPSGHRNGSSPSRRSGSPNHWSGTGKLHPSSEDTAGMRRNVGDRGVLGHSATRHGRSNS